MKAGELLITGLYEDGTPTGVRVDRADPVVEFHSHFMRDIAHAPGPYTSLVDGVLRIRAVNGTWSYRLRPGWDDEDGPLQVYGDLIQSPVSSKILVGAPPLTLPE